VQQLRDRDYVGALRTLNDYKCQNLAIVLLSLSYDEAAFEILEQLPPAEKNPKTDYLSAIALSRMNRPREGLEYYLKAIQADPVLKFRGNLDPEIQILYKQNNVKSTTYDS
jgi:tetratricopeptide (TPR) repeat protein